MAIIRSESPEVVAAIDDSAVDRLTRELHEMDLSVVDYLKSPEDKPVPDYRGLVREIQSIPERRGMSTVLAYKIDNLKYKAYYYERSWRQIRENIALAEARKKKEQERRRESYFCAPTVADVQNMDPKDPKTTDMLYEMQQLKWQEHGIDADQQAPESRSGFEQRISETYAQLKSQGNDEKELVLIWNKETQRCDLIVDKRVRQRGASWETGPDAAREPG